jgi:hypothetical protein
MYTSLNMEQMYPGPIASLNGYSLGHKRGVPVVGVDRQIIDCGYMFHLLPGFVDHLYHIVRQGSFLKVH